MLMDFIETLQRYSLIVTLKENINTKPLVKAAVNAVYTRTYSFWPAVIESGLVTQQICSVCLFVVIFVYMDEGKLDPYWLFIISSILTIIGYVINDMIRLPEQEQNNSRTRLDDMKTCLLFVAFGFGLSPLLMTLTETISTDTLYAMTSFMLIAHLVFHDYINSVKGIYQPLSLNAAIFASVCLASRLPTAFHTFATVTLAVETFALWPVLRRTVKDRSKLGHVMMTVLLGTGALVAMTTVSVVAAVLFTLGHLFVTFFCPALIIRMQPYKNNIYGPWDEAVIKD